MIQAKYKDEGLKIKIALRKKNVNNRNLIIDEDFLLFNKTI